MYRRRTPVGPLDDKPLAAVELDAEIARQDRSEWVFAIEIYDVLIVG